MKYKEIKELLEAGEKATQGEWRNIFLSSGTQRAIRYVGGILFTAWKPTRFPGQDARFEEELEETKANCEFVTAAANARPAIKALLEEVERLSNAITEIRELCTENTDDIVVEICDKAQPPKEEVE